jgi:hypothetical protein
MECEGGESKDETMMVVKLIVLKEKRKQKIIGVKVKIQNLQ